MVTVLFNDIYYLIHVEYDFINGHHYFLRPRGRREVVHFWDKQKIMLYKCLLNSSRLSVSTVDGKIHIQQLRGAF